MADKKFKKFKENMIQENEAKHGAEAREKYGNEQVDASNAKLLNMTQEEWERFQDLGNEINTRLRESVLAGVDPESEEGKAITLLHKEWLNKTWKSYSAEAHKGLSHMYTADERFTAYYDKEVSGCAEFLEKAICFWADRI